MTKGLRIAVGIAVAALVGVGAPGAAAESEGLTYLFGVVPQQSATKLAQIWSPVMERLSADTGLTIRFATATDIPTFETCLAQGAYEFAYMNPYHYTVFHAGPGYEAFAHQADKKLRGRIVVRNDNPAKRLEDLAGQEFAFPSPAAFGASVLPRAEMRRNGIAHTPVYVNSHDSVYRSVAGGIHPAGGGVTRTFNNTPEPIRAELRVIYETAAYTPHAFAALPTIAPEAVAAVSKAMLDLKATAPELLNPLGMSGIVAATDAEWDDVRALHLTQEATEIRREGKTLCRFD